MAIDSRHHEPKRSVGGAKKIRIGRRCRSRWARLLFASTGKRHASSGARGIMEETRGRISSSERRGRTRGERVARASRVLVKAALTEAEGGVHRNELFPCCLISLRALVFKRCDQRS